MLGLREDEIVHEIDRGCLGFASESLKNIPRQDTLGPEDILAKLATGVSKAIDANNRAIERQLRSAGIEV